LVAAKNDGVGYNFSAGGIKHVHAIKAIGVTLFQKCPKISIGDGGILGRTYLGKQKYAKH
jgi:hypothetical protein